MIFFLVELIDLMNCSFLSTVVISSFSTIFPIEMYFRYFDIADRLIFRMLSHCSLHAEIYNSFSCPIGDNSKHIHIDFNASSHLFPFIQLIFFLVSSFRVSMFWLMRDVSKKLFILRMAHWHIHTHIK